VTGVALGGVEERAAKFKTPRLAAPNSTAETRLTETALAAATAVRRCIVGVLQWTRRGGGSMHETTASA